MTAHASELPLGRYTVLNALQMNLVECEPDADIRSIARAMADNTIHCVVVRGIDRRDRQGNRIGWGIVSDIDLMAGLRPGSCRRPPTSSPRVRFSSSSRPTPSSTPPSSWPTTRRRTSWSWTAASQSGSCPRSTSPASRRAEASAPARRCDQGAAACARRKRASRPLSVPRGRTTTGQAASRMSVWVVPPSMTAAIGP